MKLVKTQVCIYIYEQLIKNKEIDIQKIKKHFNLEDKTFFRYINEIRTYFYNFYKGREIVYVRSEHKYKLISFDKIVSEK